VFILNAYSLLHLEYCASLVGPAKISTGYRKKLCMWCWII